MMSSRVRSIAEALLRSWVQIIPPPGPLLLRYGIVLSLFLVVVGQI
jgi:hypothetical protein